MDTSKRYLSFLTPLARHRKLLLFSGILLLVILLLGNWSRFFAPKIDYNTQVKPILNKRCIHCHGGVKKSGGFSLMTRTQALAPTESGQPAIIPGYPDRSELMRRILSDDPELRMPFEAAPLPAAEANILRKWIKQGAEWGIHWAYQAVEEVQVPNSLGTAWGSLDESAGPWERNEIDHFVGEKINLQGLSPSPRADKNTLLRRLSLDLIGVPAPDEIADRFLRDESVEAYDRLVDDLLASPQFGERWTAAWLDLARYADSKGYERDANRIIWPYRDWLIRAFNADLPYDQFLTEQLAGDLLPNPTDAQYIATGFHRNTKTNDEGGTDNEEFRVAAVIDRVNTTWEALMGTTFACTQCHGHPYDPIEHEEYYEFYAFFNNTRDEDTYDDYPWIKQFTGEDSLSLLALKSWITKVSGPEKAREIATFLRTGQPAHNSLKTDLLVNAALYDTKFLGLRHQGSARLAAVDLTGKEQLIYRYSTGRNTGTAQIRLDAPDGPLLAELSIPKTKGNQITRVDLNQTKGIHDLYFTYENPELADSDARGISFDWFHFGKVFPGAGSEEYEQYKAIFWQLLNTYPPYSLVMVENPLDMQRKSYVFDRGNWLVHKQEVQADVPDILPPFPANEAKNRLGLAKWLTSKEHPLTSRTMVNRLWEQIFGRGLVLTLEDLGTQGEPPTHPALLDWLAHKFMHEHQWSIKALLKTMVSSATYQQSSVLTPPRQEKDPDNIYYARASRVRLSAEQVRDQSLAVSGLLSSKMFGPPVKPSQPDGIWNIPYNNEKWILSEGEDRYRRALYTHWKRSALYPSMVTFDLGNRDQCSARRIRTNTPLQALVTLNDPVFIEIAQHFAKRMQDQSAKVSDQIAWAYQEATLQDIAPEKQAILEELYGQALQDFQQDQEAAQEILGELSEAPNRPKLAALVIVANAILNLDEFITKS
ncbi:MAG: DUF1553 domain-containing protein [Saprospiraceae bacterium]|nr:DUF1553 domain-containing protein [Saprospiraceae bacterium]